MKSLVVVFSGLVTKSYLILATPWTVARQASLSKGFARLLCPRDSPGKNTGVGCHCLLQSSWDGAYFNMTDILIKVGVYDKDNTDGRTMCEVKARRWPAANKKEPSEEIKPVDTLIMGFLPPD